MRSGEPKGDKARAAAQRPDGQAAPSDVTIGSYPVEPSCGTSTFSIHYAQTCAEGEYISTFVITNTQTGAVAGTVDVGIDLSSYWSLSNTEVTDEYFTTFLTSTGAGNGPWISGGGNLGCAPTNPAALSCSVSAASFPFATVDAAPGSVTHIKSYRTWAMSAAAGGDSLVAHSSYELWTYGGPLPVANPSFRLPEESVDSFVTYCDNAVGGRVAGCKAPTDLWAPTLTFSRVDFPNIGPAIQEAQSAGAPGAPSSGKTLTRSVSSEAANRAVACTASWPRPSGKNCDEYPFASTLEGAASSPANGMTPTGAPPSPCNIPVSRTSLTPCLGVVHGTGN